MIAIDRRSLVGALAFGVAAGAAPARAAPLSGVAVILIHGKAGGQGPLQPLAAALRREGAAVSLPRMSWTGGYRTYDQTLGEVASAVNAARSRGARKIVLAGHSLGANVSLGYAAAQGGVDGVVAMAPGHRPDFISTTTGDSLDQARKMVAAGEGSRRAKFMDFNQGRTFPVTTTADAYLSFFDPSGPAANAARASGVRTPVLWVIGSADRPAMSDRAPYSTGTRIEVAANHQQTPVVAVNQIVDWIGKL
ncbi:MAG: alpha/beta fold hydrolase [Rhizobiales bacterium]|nr:alpha/beta fold hydrolase [Hyphomicrobiales bacterium]